MDKAPNQMPAEKAPVATGLFNRYRKLPMPNLRLTDVDVEVLLNYMKAGAYPKLLMPVNRRCKCNI
jgi:protein SCO1/2